MGVWDMMAVRNQGDPQAQLAAYQAAANQPSQGGVFNSGIGPDVGGSDAAAALFGGPLGYEAYQAHKQKAAGADAAMRAMQDSQDQLAKLRSQQHAQRQADLQRAMGYFQPVNSLLNKMYGTPMPAPYRTDAQKDATLAATRGVASFGGRMANGQPPSAAPMFGGPPNPLAPPAPGAQINGLLNQYDRYRTF